MTLIDFENNIREAKLLQSKIPFHDQKTYNFWVGYCNGLRRHYYRELFSTNSDHDVRMKQAFNKHNEIKRAFGIGYRIGFDGKDVRQVKVILKNGGDTSRQIVQADHIVKTYQPLKLNCWEFKKCGRGIGGHKTRDLGICPAARDERLDGVHGGNNSGRACWMTAGTFCEGVPQGAFASKYINCVKCDFYKKVFREEGLNYLFASDLHKIMKRNELKTLV